MNLQNFVIDPDARILVTGAAGFIGRRLIPQLVEYGFRNIRCLLRPSRDAELADWLRHYQGEQVEIMYGNLLNQQDCQAACNDVAVVYHLAAGRGEKSYPDAYLNSVVTTRNLIRASAQSTRLKRFVNVSSFAVYSNRGNNKERLLDESCSVEARPEQRGEAYCYAKVKQEEIIKEYGERLGVPYVIIRPGAVYGPGNEAISGRVGTGTFGMFLHLGGGNAIPFTYVDNCADAIALAGLTSGVDGEVFNVVDDELPSSSRFLKLYKKNVKKFRSIYIPHFVSYMLCYSWERYSVWSDGQLPPVFNRARWYANWKQTKYSNRKAKEMLGWTPKVSTMVGLERYFDACRNKEPYA